MTKIPYPTKGLISYYTFDEKNGKDYYGNHNLVIPNTIKFKEGYDGSGYSVYIDDSAIGGFPKINKDEPFYISMWVKGVEVDDGMIYDEYGFWVNIKTIFDKYGSYDTIEFNVAIGSYLNDGLKSYTIPRGLADLKNKWNQIGLGHDLNYMYVVLNGKIIKKIEAKGIRFSYSEKDPPPEMGRSRINSGADILYAFYVDEILIYKRMPSESEIEHIYTGEPIIDTEVDNINSNLKIITKESKPNIRLELTSVNSKPKFYDALVYTDYKLEKITSNKFTIDTGPYKYADIFINSNGISKLLKNNQNMKLNNINYLLKCKSGDTIEFDGTLKEGYIIYHNGYWNDYNL
jgi:hypothetical protein